MVANFHTPRRHNYIFSLLALAAIAALAALPALPLATGLRTPLTTVAPSQPLDFGNLPLSFEPNAGQTDLSVRFIAHPSGGAIYFTPSEVVLSLSSPQQKAPERARAPSEFSTLGPEQSHPGAQRSTAKQDPPALSVLRLQFLGANPDATIDGREPLPGKVNYFIGNDPSKWYTGLPTYSTAYYGNLYPGIDLQYEGTGGQLKGTYTVAPGADPSLIQWRYQGAQSVHIDEAGNIQLLLNGEGGMTVAEQAPVAWQEIGGKQVGVKVMYNLAPDNSASFVPASYDRNYPLVIDPTLAYSTFLGGSGFDFGEAIAVDASGNAYVTGFTQSTNFPLQNPFQPILNGLSDAFVTKFSPTGSTLIYSTYLGGSGPDEGDGIAVDASGNAYVAGSTSSTNFPLQNPFQLTLSGSADAFVTKFNSTGSALLFSTYLGGSDLDISYGGIAVDASGNAYVAGYTASTNFPLQNPFQPANEGYEDAFVTKFSSTGSTLIYSTYLGGFLWDRVVDIAVDSSGNAYVTGRTESDNFPLQNPFQPANANPFDAFVTKFNSTGSALIYSTYLGGSVNDEGFGITADASGNAYVTGRTSSTDFPLQDPFQPILNGNHDVFVTKFNSTGSVLHYSTYLGGIGVEEGRSIAVDASGNAYLTGWTSSDDFPLQNPFQPTFGGLIDAFVTRFNFTGSAINYSSYLGGSGYDRGDSIAVDSSTNAYVTGETASTNFPLQNPFQPIYGGGIRDAFVAKIDPVGPLPPTATRTATPVPTSTPTPSIPTPTPTACLPGGSYDILIAYADQNGATLMLNELMAQPQAGAVDLFNAELNTPTLAQLQAYDIVLTWSQYTYHNPIAFGNTLADYQDVGGVVVAAFTSFHGDPRYYIGGRWLSQGYGPYVNSMRYHLNAATLGSHDPTHPLMQGVTTLNAGIRMDVPLRAGATQVAAYSDDSPAVAFKGRAVGLTPYLGDDEPGRASGDYARLIVNAGNFYLGGGCPSPTATPTNSPPPPTSTSTRTPTSTTILPSATTGATPTCVPQGTLAFVTIYDNYFSPQSITIPAGTRVLWTNNNDHSYAHTTTSNFALWDSGPLNDGQQFGYTFYSPGTYTYHCSIHPSMTGSIDVQPATPCPTATSTLVPPTPTGNTRVPTNTATALPTSTSTPCALTFSDVDPDNIFYTYIRCLACRFIISGYDDGTFRPFNDITRSQIAKIVSNAAGFDEDPGPQVYQDVDSTNPFYQWINRLSNRGHMGGYPCGTVDAEPCVQPDNRPYFRPFVNASRGQLAKIVANAANVGGTPTGVFYTDVEEDNPFYLWIMRLTDIGVMSGYDCGGVGEPCDPENRPYFRPFNNVTRGQASKIVANTFYPNCQTPAR